MLRAGTRSASLSARPAHVASKTRRPPELYPDEDQCPMDTPSLPADPAGSVTHFFGRLRTGDPAAAEALWERFFPRLVALARKTLVGRPQRAADADDAAQSAFASFCLRVKAG